MLQFLKYIFVIFILFQTTATSSTLLELYGTYRDNNINKWFLSLFSWIVASLNIIADCIMDSKISRIYIQSLINSNSVISQNKETHQGNVVMHKIENYEVIIK